MNNIIFIHLLNDYSGSPKVLKDTIRAVHPHMTRSKLYLGSSGDGVLSDCDIPITKYWYQRMGCKILTLFSYILSQIVLFFKLLTDHTIDKSAIIYVNTLLPFGAAFYGSLTGRKVIYHIHEISITPTPLKYFLMTIARKTSSLNIYVSDTHMQVLRIPNVPAIRVYNALDPDFIDRARKSTYLHCHDGYFNILMIASLRDYKGVPDLLALAWSLHGQTDIHIDLVVNDDEETIARYFEGRNLPPNLSIHPRTTNIAAYYVRASLVLNLSRPDQWVETFGLTILEAMAFGVPVIVPPVGGPTELIDVGVHGFMVDSRDQADLLKRVLQLHADPDLCLRMSRACRERAKDFSPESFASNVTSAINQVWNSQI